MKNLAKTILAALFLMGGLLLAGSCSKSPVFNFAGKQISFGTASQGPQTKTEYAGKANDADGKEPIWWSSNDVIRILSDKATITDQTAPNYADYKVIAQTDKSRGTLQNVAPNGLAWGEKAETYMFWGIYPQIAATDATASPITIANGGAVEATIPASQPLNGSSTDKTVSDNSTTITYKEYKPDMTYAFMTSEKEFDLESSAFDANKYVTPMGEGGPTVEMVFYPAFTAFEINLSSADEEFTVSKVELKGADPDKLAGKFSMHAGELKDGENGNVATPASDATNSVYVDEMSAAVSPTAGVTFTLFTIPKTNTKNLTLEVTASVGKARLVFKPKTGDVYPFIAGHKYRINLLKMGGRWQIFVGDLTVEPWSDGGSTNIIVEEDE